MFSRHRVSASAALLVAAALVGAVGVAAAATAAPLPQPSPGGITGRIWVDSNRNGLQDVGNREVGRHDDRDLALPRGSVRDPDLHHDHRVDGVYRFVNLPQGSYTVQTGAFKWEEFRFSPLNVGSDDSRDSDFKQIPCAPATEGKDIVGTADTTMTSGSAADLDGGVYPVL